MGRQADCELCRADRFTHWYYEDDLCWVADCEACGVPMVVTTEHGPEAPAVVEAHALRTLASIADQRFGNGGWTLDREMRQVPDHFHVHARDPNWWAERTSRPLSRYTGVGGDRQEVGAPAGGWDQP